MRPKTASQSTPQPNSQTEPQPTRNRPQLTVTTIIPPHRNFVGDGDITWHGEAANEPDWTEASRLVAYTLSDRRGGGLYVAFNTSHKPK